MCAGADSEGKDVGILIKQLLHNKTNKQVHNLAIYNKANSF